MSRKTTALLVGAFVVSSLAGSSSSASSARRHAQTPATSPTDSSRNRVTFTRDVAPIISGQCASCHRPGGSAPFALLTYSDVANRARTIGDVVQRRVMPPWKPEPGYAEFAGERRLTDAQIALIQRWILQGAVEGDPAEPSRPSPGASEWQLGEPDLVVAMPQPYRLGAGGKDVFRNFVIPIPVAERRYVKGWEFHPGNPAVVHHATMVIDPTSASRLRDEEDPEPGYEGLIPLSARNPEGYFLGWTPGQTPYVVPDQMPWTLERNSDLVLMLHLRPSGKEEAVQASLGLFFSSTPPSKTPVTVRLSRQNIDIPAGEKRYTITDSYRLPVDVDALGVQPHAHNLAREIKAFATLPDKTIRWLAYIRDWDFAWQDSYRYRTPVALPAGTVVTMEYTYDNSVDNVRNPNHPPRRVTYGQLTSNEMGELWLQVVPRHPADAARLNREVEARLLPETIVGYEMMVAEDRENAGLHDDLGLLYGQAGNSQRALQHFTESLRLKPASPAAEYNVGTALLAEGRRDAAGGHFRKAVELKGDYAPAHYGLGVVGQLDGNTDVAAREYAEALRIDQGFADAGYNLGVVLEGQGNLAAAIRQFRQLIALQPGSWPALSRLAWILATSPDPATRDATEAVRLGERATELTGHANAAVLDVLGAALASAGRFEEAETHAQTALTLATTAGDAVAASRIRGRLELYKSRVAYRELP
jgi:tetratricopeptide (TPR) repeat protein/mono/diheme cytochrome c family protein